MAITLILNDRFLPGYPVAIAILPSLVFAKP